MNTFALLFFSGLRKLIFQYFTFGVGEYYRGIIKSAQVKQLQRYIPSLKVEDVERYVAKCRFIQSRSQNFLVGYHGLMTLLFHSFNGSQHRI